MDPDKRLETMLEQAGAVLVRHKKHQVYRLPGGRSFTASTSPSDHRSALNSIRTLKRVLRTQDVSMPNLQPISAPPAGSAPLAPPGSGTSVRAWEAVATPTPSPTQQVPLPGGDSLTTTLAQTEQLIAQRNEQIAGLQKEVQSLQDFRDAVRMSLDAYQQVRGLLDTKQTAPPRATVLSTEPRRFRRFRTGELESVIFYEMRDHGLQESTIRDIVKRLTNHGISATYANVSGTVRRNRSKLFVPTKMGTVVLAPNKLDSRPPRFTTLGALSTAAGKSGK